MSKKESPQIATATVAPDRQEVFNKELKALCEKHGFAIGAELRVMPNSTTVQCVPVLNDVKKA